MKSVYLFFLVGLSMPFQSRAQQTSFPEGYYVIVGAFAKKENAAKFNAALHVKSITSSYGYLPSRKLYYVYTLNDQNASRCVKVASELRKEAQFADAWVRYINEKALADTIGNQEIAEPVVKKEEPVPQPVVVEKPVEVQPETLLPEVTPNEEIVQYDKVTLGNTEVFLSLYNAQNDKVAEGKVQVIDTERGRMITEVKGNDYLILPDPKSKSGQVSLLVDVFGYRKVQKELNFNNPLADSSVVEQMGTTLVVNFELVRYAKGDFRTLYNIYFFNDAAVMLPESRYELNALLDLMKENLKYRIRLHGHTNGNYHGKIIKRKSDGDFFSVAKDATTTIGSAKELSESRAEVIRDYLVTNGVESSRVEIKSWGGKRPLFDKHSANAKKNIRVEVEIVSE